MRQLSVVAGSQAEAARLIAEHTRRPCSKDAIKSWTCDPCCSRARTCHDWAITALEARLEQLGKLTQ